MRILDISESYPEHYWLNYNEEKNIEQLRFISCSKINPLDIPLLKFEADKRANLFRLSKYDYLFSSGPDLVSKKLASIIAGNVDSEDIQFFPASISNGSQELFGFSVIHYTRCESAINLTESTSKPLLTYMPNGPKTFTHVVLKNGNPAHHMFRALESTDLVIVTDSLAAILESQKIVGITLRVEK